MVTKSMPASRTKPRSRCSALNALLSCQPTSTLYTLVLSTCGKTIKTLKFPSEYSAGRPSLSMSSHLSKSTSTSRSRASNFTLHSSQGSTRSPSSISFSLPSSMLEPWRMSVLSPTLRVTFQEDRSKLSPRRSDTSMLFFTSSATCGSAIWSQWIGGRTCG